MKAVKKFISQLVDDGESRVGILFIYLVQALIVLSLITFSVSTMPGIERGYQVILERMELTIVVLFTMEYFLRIYVAGRPQDFIFSFYGLVDLMAILPFYITMGVDLRAVRILRILRALRLLKLVRYNRAASRYHRALSLVWEELVLFIIVSMIFLYLTAVGIYYFENAAQPDKFTSVFHSMWWALTSLTTVGFGDMYPVTVGGKIFTYFVLMIGLGTVAVPTGLLATALAQARREEVVVEK
jgi:voltage-gated potassium channel